MLGDPGKWRRRISRRSRSSKAQEMTGLWAVMTGKGEKKTWSRETLRFRKRKEFRGATSTPQLVFRCSSGSSRLEWWASPVHCTLPLVVPWSPRRDDQECRRAPSRFGKRASDTVLQVTYNQPKCLTPPERVKQSELLTCNWFAWYRLPVSIEMFPLTSHSKHCAILGAQAEKAKAWPRPHGGCPKVRRLGFFFFCQRLLLLPSLLLLPWASLLFVQSPAHLACSIHCIR